VPIIANALKHASIAILQPFNKSTPPINLNNSLLISYSKKNKNSFTHFSHCTQMHIVTFSKLQDKGDLKEYKPLTKMESKELNMSSYSMHQKMSKLKDFHLSKFSHLLKKSYNLSVQYASKLNHQKDSSSNAIINSIINV